MIKTNFTALKNVTSQLLLAGLATALMVLPSSAQSVIADDSFADGDRAKTGALDTSWWTSSSLSGIEVSPGSLGLVSGTSGRGIHTVFPAQTFVNNGDSLTATYTFITPDTVAMPGSSASFRVGLLDSLGRTGLATEDQEANSGNPNDLYGNVVNGVPGLPGFMMDHDVNNDPVTDDLSFRSHITGFPTGRLMATTTGWLGLGSGPDAPDASTPNYSFVPNTEYTGSFTVTKTSATEFALSGTIENYSYTLENVTIESNVIDMLAFHANSNRFGSTNSPNEPDNGIDFTNVRVEFLSVPEPSSMMLLGVMGITLVGLRRKARRGNRS